MARNFHAQRALRVICDIDAATLNATSELYPDISLEMNYEAVLKDPCVFQIAIAMPLSFHYQMARKALLAGKDVFVEKPFCLDVSEALELANLTGKNRLVLMIGHILHYHPLIMKIKDLIKTDQLGTLQHFVARRYHPPSPDNHENVLWDLAPHDISLLLSLSQQVAPRNIQCSHTVCNSRGDIDEACLSLDFGTVMLQVQICISRLRPVKEQTMMLAGSKTTLIFADTKPWEEKLAMYQEKLDPSLDFTIQHRHLEPRFLHVPYVEPLKLECAHFLECCVNSR